jgi:hypothetical protein
VIILKTYPAVAAILWGITENDYTRANRFKKRKFDVKREWVQLEKELSEDNLPLLMTLLVIVFHS